MKRYRNEAVPIEEYLKSLDQEGGARETKEILESLPRQIDVRRGRSTADNAFVCLNKSHCINGVPVVQIWIGGSLLELEAKHVVGDIAPFFEG